MLVERLDFGRFSKVTRTPQGGLKVPANLTRIGVFKYTRADGTTVRELRHPDEVFNADSLASLAGAPVTDLHPSRKVGPSNWRQLSIGHVGENVRADGKFVAAPLMIQDGDAIAKVERGDSDPEALREVSCGYTCGLDDTPGVFEGERYDVAQRNIRYNHVALGPKDWGRAGNEVALRLDAHGNQTHNPTGNSPPTKKREKPMTKVTRIDGVDYEVGSDAHISKLEEMNKAKVAKEAARADAAEGERDAVKAERDVLQAKLDVANDPKTLDNLVADRVKLVTDARKVLGNEPKLDGKSAREIMVEAIRHDTKDFDEKGKSDDYIQAFFDASTRNVSRHDEGGTGIGAARSAARSSVRNRRDRKDRRGRRDREDRRDHDDDNEEVDRYDADAAKQRMHDTNRDAAEQPLRHTRSN